MLTIQAVRGLPRLRAPGIVPCIISFSRQSTSLSPMYRHTCTYAVLAVGDGGPPPPRYAALGTGCALLLHHCQLCIDRRTYAELAVGDGWRSVVLADVVVVMRITAADRKHEVIAVARRVAERPVVWITGRSRSLERERENAIGVAQRRIHDVLYGVGRRLRVPA